MAVDFVFNRPVTPTPGPVDLVFGDGGDSPDIVEATLAAALPSAVAGLGLVPAVAAEEVPASDIKIPATLAATLPAVALPALDVAASAHQSLPASLAAALPAVAPPALTVAATAQQAHPATLAAPLPAVGLQSLGFAATADYDSALHTGIAVPCLAPHTTAAARAAGLIAATQTAARRERPLRADHATAAPRTAGIRACLQQLPQRHRATRLPIYTRAGVGQGLRISQYQRPAAHRPLRSVSHHTQQLGKGLALGQFDLARILRPLQILRTESAPRTGAFVLHIRAGRLVSLRRCLPIYRLRWPAPGKSPRPPAPIDPDSALVQLVFVRPQDSTNDLIFNYQPGARPVGPIIIIPQKEYFMLFDASLRLADTDEVIEHAGFTLGLDADSWAWSWSASIPAWYLDAVRPSGPTGFVELIATIHDQEWRLLVESLERERRFGRSQLRIGSRGRSAWLASPHAPTETRYNTAARTAQQLLEDALTINGVPIGWAVDWQIEDWLIPAGHWSHTGTYMEAALRIAEAAGAYVQPHPTDDVLRVLPRYPAPPWEWSELDPDIVLPEAVVTLEGITWQDKPRYDAVWLAGDILANVRRAGTSGGSPAPMVTDPLLTAEEATRQRGISILSNAGRQAHVSITVPVLPELGVVTPGQIIDYTESGTTRRGIARSVSVQVNRPKITQTIAVETHELEPI